MIEHIVGDIEPGGDGPWTLRYALVAVVLLLGLWTVFGFLSSVHFFFQEGPDARFGETASHVVVFYWGWAILTPLVVALTRRVTNSSRSIWARTGMMGLFGATVVVLHGVLYPVLVRLLGVDSQAPIDPAGLKAFAVRHGGGDFATFAVIVGACLLFDASWRERKRALASAALQGQLARAELEVLRWQLHPHFLFNALNTVSTLVLKGDGEAADRAIGLISLYLRHALAQRADAMVTLREELATVSRYIDVERLRFGDTLVVQEMLDANALDASVPSLILQPLVENAIRHGFGRSADQRPIAITVAIEKDRLRIGVTNPRAAAAPKGRPDGGRGNDEHTTGGGDHAGSSQFGLRYVRERLEQFYGAGASFELVLNESESVATLDLPFVTVNGATPDAIQPVAIRAPAS